MPEPSQDPESVQETWNQSARADAVAEFGVLTAVEIDALHGPGTAAGWLQQQRMVSVPGPDGPLFPAFQFHQGEPLPIIADIIEALNGQLKEWETLLWFTASNGNLNGMRPVDGLTKSPQDVVRAASYQASLSED